METGEPKVARCGCRVWPNGTRNLCYTDLLIMALLNTLEMLRDTHREDVEAETKT